MLYYSLQLSGDGSTASAAAIDVFQAAERGHEQHRQIHAQTRTGQRSGPHPAQSGHVFPADGFHRQRGAETARSPFAHRQSAAGGAHSRPIHGQA